MSVELWTGLAVLIVNILNFVTKHFTKSSGVKKWILWVAEMISVVASEGTERWFKLPFQSVPPLGTEGARGSGAAPEEKKEFNGQDI